MVALGFRVSNINDVNNHILYSSSNHGRRTFIVVVIVSFVDQTPVSTRYLEFSAVGFGGSVACSLYPEKPSYAYQVRVYVSCARLLGHT